MLQAATRASLQRGGRRSMVTGGIVFALALTLWILHWHGLDYPAQIYRAGLARRHGFSLWDANWYGGHYTPAYGVLLPFVASVVGLAIPAIVSTFGSVVLFERLLIDARLPHPVAGTTAFTLMMLVNTYEGRLPFGCGVLLGLLAVTLARRRRWRWTALAALLTTLASPVAGAFLALAFAAWALGMPVEERWRRLQTPTFVLCVLTLLATGFMSAVFPEGGFFPYDLINVVIAVVAGALAWWLLPPSLVVVRWGFLLADLLVVPLYVIPNPMGGNLSRLAIIGAPLLCAVPRRRVLLHVAVCAVLLGQQAVPLLSIPSTVEDPSTKAAYYQPLIAAVQERTSGPVRLEIPTTEHHWEAAYVARHIPLARGWERQLDLRYNAILYDPAMTPEQYHAWLIENGVSFVAVPDAVLETVAVHEADVARRASFLRPTWHNAHWQLYEVLGSPALSTGPAKVVKMSSGVVRLDVFRTDPILLRMRFSSHLTVVRGAGCVSRTTDGWTRLQPATTGRITLRMRLFPTHLGWCPP